MIQIKSLQSFFSKLGSKFNNLGRLLIFQIDCVESSATISARNYNF